MIFEALLSILCSIFAYFFYYHYKIHNRFASAGLKYLPGVPVFGNVWKSTLLRRHFIYDLGQVYDAFPDEKYVGFLDGMVPVILVRDPELMKTITIKDFDHFRNRKEFFPVRLDPLLGRNLLQLKDDEWKSVRTQLSPAFTAARLRYMLPALINVSKNVVDSLKKYSSKDVELTESMYRYTGDSLASAAFGLDQEFAGRENSLLSTFSANIYFNFWRRVLIFISTQLPHFGEIIKSTTGLQLFPKEIHKFLRELIFGALEYRKNNGILMPDYMDVLQKISEGKSINDLAGQFFFSYAASLESGSATLRLCFHELALNPEIQHRLYQEIRDHEEVGEMTMESINGLTYLDCVLKEISRKWSAAVMMDRICTKTYTLPPPREGGKPYLLRRGDMVFNVVNPVQMDPKYHPNPEVFDPERFTPKNKKRIQPFTFMPFGMGPRGCLGVRFAILQMKIMIYYMILNFKLVKCGKTTDPIMLEPDEMNMKAKDGTWVRLELRQ